QLYATSVRLYFEAFQSQPRLADDLHFRYRYYAACAAARAGTGPGKDMSKLNDTARAEMRYRALSWLTDDLSAHARQLVGKQPRTAEQVRQTLLHWQKNPDLAGVREPEALCKQPEAEQVVWLNLWAQVDALLARLK